MSRNGHAYCPMMALADYRADFNTGATWEVSADLVFDVGVRIGLTGDADDVGVFSGMSIRF